MATQQIFEDDIRTKKGTCTLRIYDTNTNSDTPSLKEKGIIGGIDLKFGDTGDSSDEFPIGCFGSYFDLAFRDNESNDFRNLFNNNFGFKRFRVELEFPSSSDLKTWYGFVKPEIQERPISDRTRENIISLTCLDGLGNMKEIPPLEGVYNESIQSFLIRATAQVNKEIDISYFTDTRGNRADTADSPVGLQQMIANEDKEGQFAPLSERYRGLEGSSIREQLENLCKTLHTAFYQDIRIESWVLMDFAAIGKPVDGKRFDRGSNITSSYTFPDNTKQIDQITDESDDVLEPHPSIRKVCVDRSKWELDPKIQQYSDINTSNDSDVYWWAFSNATFQTSGNDNVETEIKIAQGSNGIATVRPFIGIDIDYIDAARCTSKAGGDGRTAKEITLEYGDGTEDSKTQTVTGPILIEADKSKDVLENVKLEFFEPSSLNNDIFLYEYNLELLLKEDVIQPDGSTTTEYTRIDTVCFVDDGDGRRVEETNKLVYITQLGDGSRATSDGYFSRRYNNVGVLERWRAKNLLALAKPGIDQLRTKVIDSWLPLGTRIEYTKPEDSSPSQFVHQTGRELSIFSDEDVSTDIYEVQIADTVDNLI